jgi:hypothetical protein
VPAVIDPIDKRFKGALLLLRVVRPPVDIGKLDWRRPILAMFWVTGSPKIFETAFNEWNPLQVKKHIDWRGWRQ